LTVWIMEPAAAWGPYCHQFQLSNWTVEEPAAGLPVEYASIDIPGTCGLQAYVPESSGGQQLVEYNYYHAASNSKHMSQQVGDVDGEAKISNDSHARSVVRQVLGEFKDDIGMTMAKMHRYPACLGAVDKCYTSPRIVAIGPYYHHRLDHLKQAEKVKHAAACHCVKRSGRLLEELYEAVVPIADAARRLYDKDVMAGISYDNFRHMMFFDACFLVQYMLMRGRTEVIDESLSSFMSPNRIDIFHDIMLLENQLPWEVVEIVMSFMPVPMSLISKKFVARMRHCMLPDDRHEPLQQKPFIWYEGYKPPHLLGLLRHYIVGKSDVDYPASMPKNIAFSVSAMELAEIGITLTANKTTELVDMRLINKVGTLFAELSLPPLSLDRDCASYLVNMVALELCTVKSFSEVKASYSAVCSYILLLAMLVYREEDVHELRARGILQGGGGLTNKEALRFFTSFQGLRFGPYYYHIMLQIESYRDRSRMKTKLLTLIHNHKKTIATVVTGIGAVGGIIATLLSIKKSL
jgi:hypothetical protein